MTTYRRFCCNDLLRFASLNLPSGSKARSMKFYLTHLAKWPGNCHVADEPGGRIAGYIFGSVERMNEECTGLGSVIRVPYRHLPQLVKNLTKLLEDSCDKIYNAYTMRILIYAHDTTNIHECEKLGYIKYKGYPFRLEMRKPLSRLLKIVQEETQKESTEGA